MCLQDSYFTDLRGDWWCILERFSWTKMSLAKKLEETADIQAKMSNALKHSEAMVNFSSYKIDCHVYNVIK